MIFDWDDFHQTNHRFDLLTQLKEANPDFRCTLFAVPALGSLEFWETIPDWCELVFHGWTHPDAHECSQWSRADMDWYIGQADTYPMFVRGFKAPGWQINENIYAALLDAGWWCADHYENDHRRPDGLLTHRLSPTASSGGDPNHWHGHVQDVCGNGLEETWPQLLDRVRNAESFELVSDSVSPWISRVAA